MGRALMIVVALAFAGCAQMASSPNGSGTTQFKPVTGKSVIYIVRPKVGASLGDTLYLNDDAQITTWVGTYYRWETEPGQHRITGFGPTSASITMTTESGKIYFVLHKVNGNERAGAPNVFLQPLDEQSGQALVMLAQPI